MDGILEVLSNIGMGFLLLVVLGLVWALVLAVREALRQVNGKD
jgi:hypothetical protein